MRALLVLIACSALAGCWVGSDAVARKVADVPDDTDTDTDTDTDEPLGPLVFEALFPEVGSSVGGSVVSIDIGPLDPSDVEVSFGGVPAEVLSADAEQVVVETPQVTLQGAVDVVISSAGRTHRESGAYFYWADGEGRAGLLGVVENYDVNRRYLTPRGHYRAARALWVEPINLRWWELYTDAIDTCSRDFSRSGPSVSILRPGVPELILDDGRSPVSLLPDAEGEAFRLPFESGTLPRRIAFDVLQGDGGPGWRELLVPGAVELPEEGFELLEPSMDLDIPRLPRRGSVTLRWSGGRPGTLVLVRILRRNSDGAIVDDISCALTDDGHHVVDSRLWSDWDAFADVDFYVGRVIERTARIPFNNAEARLYGIQWWYGEASQAP